MKIFDRIEQIASFALLGLMTLIVFASILEVAWVLATEFLRPPGFVIGVDDLFDLFGLVLMVLIGLELMTSMRLYLENHTIHAELMLLIAITAITRKVVILDAYETDPLTLFGIGFIIITLTAGFFLLRKSGERADLQPTSNG